MGCASARQRRTVERMRPGWARTMPHRVRCLDQLNQWNKKSSSTILCIQEPGENRFAFFCLTAAFNIFTSFTCLLFTDRNSQYWRGFAPSMVEEIPLFDGRISPAWWKDLLPYCGRISRPIVEENRRSWKVLPTHRGRISPLSWKDFPCAGSDARLMPPKPMFALRLHEFRTISVSNI